MVMFMFRYISPLTVWQIFSALAEQTLHRHQVSWPHLPLQYLHGDICSAGILGSSTHTFPLSESLPTVSWALRTSRTILRVEISTCWADLHRSGLIFRLEGCCFLILWSSTIGCTQPLVSLQSYKQGSCVNCYTFIIAHLVTYEDAIKLPIGHVVELAERRYGKDSKMGDHLRALYNRVKGQWFMWWLMCRTHCACSIPYRK